MFNSTEDLITEIRNGKMVVLVDDPHRENEGDLVMAAEFVTPEAVNFMIKHARGLLCLPLTEERAKQLELPRMVTDNQSRFHTNFTVSIGAAEGITTGISAKDRAVTIRAAAAPHAKPTDLVRPGHVFPLIAKENGVLTRPGHTEGICDLARLAGLSPMGVLLEILDDLGNAARGETLLQFAKQFQLKIGTIADLIQYRIKMAI